MEDKLDLKPRYGIVAMIDALGVRNATIEESINFIKNIQDAIECADSYISAHLEQSLAEKKIKKDPPKFVTFGDTLVFTWEMKPEELSDYLPDVGIFLSFLIIVGLDHKMAFRGAILVGDYIQNGSTVLGPAIADVASWYDCSEIIGVFATPYCGQLLNSIRENRPFYQEFLQYPVPLKGGISKDLWLAAWPEHLEYICEDSKTTKLQYYYSLIQNFHIPKGVEDKYFNTEKFLKWCLAQKP